MSADEQETVSLNIEGFSTNKELVDKAEDSTQLDEHRIQSRAGLGVKPPYNPDRLASYLELNETHSVAVRKKSRYEVGFGFEIVPVEDIDPDEADQSEFDTVEDFWRSRESKWQTGPHLSAEPTTAEEVFELARQDYHAIGWLCIEILVNNMGEPVGLAHVPANTVRVRKPEGDEEREDVRGYVQEREGRRRYFGEAGDRYKDNPLFVDRETGDVAEGSAGELTNDPANELIFVRNPSPLSLHYGIPTWISAIRTISADESAKDYNREFFDNDTIPRLAIKVTGGELSEESKKDLRQMLQNLRDESHRTVLLEVDKFNDSLGEDVSIELEPISQGVSEEMSFRAFREKNEHEIAKVHGIPPVLIGVTETSNRANSRSQVHEFATEVIAPEQNKFAERLYQIIHQQAFGVTDWTIEFKLRGGDQPREEARVASEKINAVQGAIPVNRALAMIGEDPLPEDHPVDGQTLIANIGQAEQPAPFNESGVVDNAMALPAPENKIGERHWSEVEDLLAIEDGVATKAPLETHNFDSSNLDEGLFDFGENELYLSFKREGSNSLYIYVNVPTTVWQSLVTASSAGSYHYANVRLSYPYLEITNHHSRLPEGPTPDPEDIPEDLPTSI